MFENGEVWAGAFAHDRPGLAPGEAFAPASTGVQLQVRVGAVGGGERRVEMGCTLEARTFLCGVDARQASIPVLQRYCKRARMPNDATPCFCGTSGPHLTKHAWHAPPPRPPVRLTTWWRRRRTPLPAAAPSATCCCATTPSCACCTTSTGEERGRGGGRLRGDFFTQIPAKAQTQRRRTWDAPGWGEVGAGLG